MVEKKNNHNILSSEKLVVSIKDGYQSGDKLNLNLDLYSVHSMWNSEDKSLIVDNTSNLEFSQILNNLYLEGDNNGQGRFVEVAFIDDKGDNINLKEFEIEPVYKDFQQQFDTFHSDLISYQELQGGDFLSYDSEEKLSFVVEKKEDGDIYKILKDSFLDNNEIEIWGYDLNSDKIDIGEFVDNLDLKNLNATVSKNDSDVLVSFGEQSAYNIVLKDISGDTSNDKLEEVLNSLILDSFNIKVG